MKEYGGMSFIDHVKWVSRFAGLTALAVLTAATLTSCGGGAGSGPENGNAAAAKPTKVTVVLDWTPNTNHTGLYVAQAKGFYADEGLDVEIMQPPEDGANALVAAGKAEFGIGFQDTMASALAADPALPITAVAAVIQHNTSGLISAKGKGIDSFKALEGKNYATWDTPLEKAVIGACMAAEGGDVTKVTFIPSTVTNVLTALAADIDTVWVYEGWDVVAAQVEGFEYNYLDFAKTSPVLDYYTPVIISGDKFLSDSPDVAKRFLRATGKGYEYCAKNPGEAADILLAAAPELDAALVKASQEFLAGQYVAEQESWGYIDPARWEAFYDWAYKNGVVAKELGASGFSNAYLD
ncbi:MAG: ABC transporter substrate-binding protein [Lachnospiraceae bacterium]|jgi:ABC-type nitrate/sulfonate/bicarbonate transport system substrate-binding protein|nr:ABC transporter substrate-binding protein [Lachnospiraceae bacterium]